MNTTRLSNTRHEPRHTRLVTRSSPERGTRRMCVDTTHWSCPAGLPGSERGARRLNQRSHAARSDLLRSWRARQSSRTRGTLSESRRAPRLAAPRRAARSQPGRRADHSSRRVFAARCRPSVAARCRRRSDGGQRRSSLTPVADSLSGSSALRRGGGGARQGWRGGGSRTRHG